MMPGFGAPMPKWLAMDAEIKATRRLLATLTETCAPEMIKPTAWQREQRPRCCCWLATILNASTGSNCPNFMND